MDQCAEVPHPTIMGEATIMHPNKKHQMRVREKRLRKPGPAAGLHPEGKGKKKEGKRKRKGHVGRVDSPCINEGK
eukprot:1149953-Pelagomonas_calceolata.AAC.1